MIHLPYTLTTHEFAAMAVQIGRAVPKGGNEHDVRVVMTIGMWRAYKRWLNACGNDKENTDRFFGTIPLLMNLPGLWFGCKAMPS